MEKEFDLDVERECFSCFYDLHLSAASCNCSSDKFACPKHASLICHCDPENRLVRLRYTIDELNTLVKALEECMDALQAWASKDRGGPLHSIDLDGCDIAGHNKLFGSDRIPSSFPTNTTPMKIEYMEEAIYNVSKVCSDSKQNISSSIEPVSFGTVVYRKLWCNKDAIFPKGMLTNYFHANLTIFPRLLCRFHNFL